MVVQLASAALAISTSTNVANAGNKLWSSLKIKDLSPKATEIRNMSRQQGILPEPSDTDTQPFVRTPLMNLIQDAYTAKARGDSHVIYARPSIGKTSACLAFMKLVARKRKIQALMITGAPKNTPYLTHLATVLNVDHEENVLVDLVAGMKTIEPSPASVLILDEMNDLGDHKCNITLVDVLMRYIYQQSQGIHLFVLTQNEEVANELCNLNKWQKIAPLNGLTNPSRNAVRDQEEALPGIDVPWMPSVLEWTSDSLTKFIDTGFKDHGFEKNEGVISWLKEGMTPTNAEQKALELIERARREALTETEDEYAEAL